RPAGHWNLYPLVYRADAPLGGTPDLFELSPRELVARARLFAPGAIVQVNHPRSGAPTGMFDVVAFDRATAQATHGDMAPTFDAIEVWNGRALHAADDVLLDWLALLRTGARITGTANSDSHAIVVQEIGYPRTCFHSPGGGARLPTADDVVHALRVDRDAVLTDGPMIHVSAPGLPRAIGRIVPGDGPSVALTVRVDSARWNAPDTLEMLHADGRAEPVTASFAREGERVHAEATVTVARTEGFVLFRARGAVRIPVLVDDPPLTPLAFTNPIYLHP
ncbi:MAG: CehA/McbA family metallohydrolase, partial [Deltaproteobacteria bacterium]